MEDRSQQAERIRREMCDVRAEIDTDVDRIVDEARDLANWRTYVADYPWVFAGAAVAVGFMVVPRRTEIVRPDLETLEALAKRQRLVVEPQPKPSPAGSFTSSMVSLLGNLAIRYALTVAGQQMGKILGGQAVEAEKVHQEL